MLISEDADGDDDCNVFMEKMTMNTGLINYLFTQQSILMFNLFFAYF